MFSDRTEIDTLADEEFAKIEQRVEKLLSVWEIKNLRGQAAGTARLKTSKLRCRGRDGISGQSSRRQPGRKLFDSSADNADYRSE